MFDCWIPFLPPGINCQYGHSRYGKWYLTPRARKWKQDASIFIGARAGQLSWQDCGKRYIFEMTVCGSRADADAYIKTVVDTVTSKLGFDDRRICEVTARKRPLPEMRRELNCIGSERAGIYVVVRPEE